MTKKLPFPVDVVFTYVNGDDPLWQEDFISATGSLPDDTQNGGKIRYHDSGTLKVALKSIEKFAKWRNNVYLIVSGESQVPDWLPDYVKIIYHRDFIPQEYLPCFNSATIEIFFPFLPFVEEHFVYFNDDMILLGPTTDNMFFTKNGIPRMKINLCSLEGKHHYFKYNINAYNMALGVEQSEREILPQHGAHPQRISWMRECFDKNKKDILENISPLRRGYKDQSQYIYLAYYLFQKEIDQFEIDGVCIYDKIKAYFHFFANPNRLKNLKWICMNESGEASIIPFVKIVEDYINKS